MSKLKNTLIRLGDWLVPRPMLRWIAFLSAVIVYGLRIFYRQGFHVITYGLGIYLLNLFIGFLSPRDDPAIQELLGHTPTLPTTDKSEFRPFVRRVPEYTFWVG